MPRCRARSRPPADCSRCDPGPDRASARSSPPAPARAQPRSQSTSSGKRVASQNPARPYPRPPTGATNHRARAREVFATPGISDWVVASVVLGVLAAPGAAQDLATDVEDRLADELHERHPDADWKVELVDEAPDGRTVRELKETAREQMRKHRWAMALVLTDLPLLSGRRPVTAHANCAAARGRGVRACARPPQAEGAPGGGRRELRGRHPRRARRQRRPPARASGRMAARLQELGSPLGAAHFRDESTIRFTSAVIRGNLRLLAGWCGRTTRRSSWGASRASWQLPAEPRRMRSPLRASGRSPTALRGRGWPPSAPRRSRRR